MENMTIKEIAGHKGAGNGTDVQKSGACIKPLQRGVPTMSQKKYRIEKILHELIRDVPEIEKANDRFEKGFLTLDDFFREVVRIYRTEMEKTA